MIVLRKWLAGTAALTAALFLFAGIAGAHVVVSPGEVPAGSYQVFTVRVPSETKGTSTVSVKVAMPEGVNVSRTEPKPGWTVERENREDGSAVSVTWTADDGKGLAETEFTEFRMQGRVADDATELVWKAYQTYADGSVAEWVGADKNAQHPASVTAVTAAAGGSDGHGAAPAEAAEETEASAAGDLGLWLGAAGCVLGLAALAVAAAGRRKRA